MSCYNRVSDECPYELVLPNRKQLETLYTWIVGETNFEQYTCRPVSKPESLEAYLRTSQENIGKGHWLMVLVAKENREEPLGQIKFFDYNGRNQSGELGYYLPPVNRGKKLGEIMLGLFLNLVFGQGEQPVNKVMATTSSSNKRSVQLLKKVGFNQEGALRAHYWIGQEQYDQLLFSMLKQEFRGKK